MVGRSLDRNDRNDRKEYTVLAIATSTSCRRTAEIRFCKIILRVFFWNITQNLMRNKAQVAKGIWQIATTPKFLVLANITALQGIRRCSFYADLVVWTSNNISGIPCSQLSSRGRKGCVLSSLF